MNYLSQYLLTFFNQESFKTNQLIHVLNGKRTPSMLFFVEKNNIHPLFKLAPYLSSDELDKMLLECVAAGYLKETEQGYQLTTRGKDFSNEFKVRENIYPVDHLRWSNFSEEFFECFQFLTQIYSEASYQNNKYRPLIKEISSQQWLKKWIFSFSFPLEEQSMMWAHELISLFNQLTPSDANLLANHLTGHQMTGQTKQAIIEKNLWNEEKYNIYLRMLTYQIMDKIYENNDWMLLHRLLISLYEKNDYGLSASTAQTVKMLNQGMLFDEIATIRHLKVGTIYEHLQEAALVDNEFDFSPFLSQKDDSLSQLRKLLENNPLMKYREIKDKDLDVPFVKYRLMQLKVLREKRGEQ